MVKFKTEVSNSRVCNASPQWQKTYTIKGKQVKIWYSGDPAWKMTAEIPYGTSYEIGRFKANEPISQQEAEKLVKPVWGKMVRSARNSRVCNDALPSRFNTGAWMKILEESPAAKKVLFTIDPAQLSVYVEPYAHLLPGSFKVVKAPSFPPITLKTVRAVKYDLLRDNGYPGGEVVDLKTGETRKVKYWSARKSKYDDMLYAAFREYMAKLDKLQGVKIDYDEARREAYKQDNRDYLYHKASLLNSTDPVVRRALNAAVARNGWSPKQEKAVEKDLTAALSTIKAAATRIGLKGVSVSVDKYEHENVLIYSQNGETRGWRNIIDELYRALPRDYSLGLIRIAGPTVAIRVVPPCPNFMKVSE